MGSHQGDTRPKNRVYECVRIFNARACDPACLKYRSGEIKYMYGYVYKCVFVFVAVNNCGFVFVFGFTFLVAVLLWLLFSV